MLCMGHSLSLSEHVLHSCHSIAKKGFLALLISGTPGGIQLLKADNAPQAPVIAEAPLTISSGYGLFGLVLWISADSGVTLDKDNQDGVAVLKDKTGNFILTPNSAEQEPILVPKGLNSKPMFRFNSGQSLYSPDDFGTALNRDMTIIIVAMTTSTAGEEFPLYLGQNATQGANRALAILNGKYFFDGQFVGCYGAPAVKTFTMEGATLNSSLSQGTFYRNGALIVTGSVAEENKNQKRNAAFISLSEGVTLGAATDPACGWRGDIAEALVFNRQLSPAEMQMVWSALSDKYGLHPITAAPPATKP
jgi:hypothetical protein